MDMTVFTVGAVVRPGERFMDIVPQNSPLIVEADLPVKDIAKVRVGQAAKVQLSAFTHNEAQPFEATIVYVSADRVVAKGVAGEQPIYKIHAQISQEDLAKQHIEMSAGMPAMVYVLTKEKTLVGYLLEPITDTFGHALRE
jgi:multidrug efflux pump subunit AcrA (membrane-fusion protein)